MHILNNNNAFFLSPNKIGVVLTINGVKSLKFWLPKNGVTSEKTNNSTLIIKFKKKRIEKKLIYFFDETIPIENIRLINLPAYFTYPLINLIVLFRQVRYNPATFNACNIHFRR